MTGKTDMVPVLDLPSHLSQPSQSENVPIFDSGTRCYFVPKNHAFGANPGKEKGNSQPRRTSRPLPAVLPPVGRCVASWGGGGVRIPPQPIWVRVGEFFDAPKAKQPAMDLSRDKNAEKDELVAVGNGRGNAGSRSVSRRIWVRSFYAAVGRTGS